MPLLAELKDIGKIEQEPRNYLTIRALGSGIQNVLFADVRTAADAEACVRAVLALLPRLYSAPRREAGELRLVAGDLFMILATIAWSFYSWMLMRTREPAAIRADWASFLAAQVAFGALWSGAFALGEQWLGAIPVQWSWWLAAALLYVAVFPAVIAFRCWGEGVQRAGPAIGAFFVNLTPLFTALLSSASVEISSRGHQVAELRDHFAEGTDVTITFLPGDNYRHNVETATALRRAGS